MASFAVSDITAKILKNFAGISDQILLVEGKTQKTVASGKSVLAIAELPEAWPQETGIFSLNTFLGTLSLFTKPEIEFDEDVMVIRGEGSRVRYRISDPSTITQIPNKTFPTQNPEVLFVLSDKVLAQINRTCSLLELNTVVISADGGRIFVRASDAKNPKSHAFEFEVPPQDIKHGSGKFTKELPLKQEHVAMLLDGSYEVSVSSWSYAYFKHTSVPISYFVVGQAKEK